MKKKVKKVISLINNNSFNRIIIELILLVSLFSLNPYIGIALLLVILSEIVISNKNENLLYIYIFLSFFDEVLILDVIKGSISRIVMLFIFFKLGIYIIKNKIIPNKLQISVFIFFIASFFIELTTTGLNTESIVILANILIFILFSMTINLRKTEEINSFVEKLCLTIVFAVINGIMHGILSNNFLEEIVDYEKNSKIYRFNGTYEPNFMCMFINLGILSLLTVKDKINKIFYYIFMAIMINFSLLTASITGIITLVISFIIYIFLNIKKKKINYLNAIMIIIITFVLFVGIKIVNYPEMKEVNITGTHEQIKYEEESESKEEKDSEKESESREEKDSEKESNNLIEETSLVQRLNRIKKLIKSGKLDEVTSGRIPLLKTFISKSFSRPLLSVLFGNGLTNKKIYCAFFHRDCYSHNSYADFLYNFGIIGFILIMTYMFYKTKKNCFLNMNITNTKYADNIKMIRILLLLYALSLTLYTKRMFLIFFLL